MTKPNFFNLDDFQQTRICLVDKFLSDSHKVHTDTWQGLAIKTRPEARMRELVNVGIQVDMKGIEDLEHWRDDIGPNLPWADDHFLERVCGQPINPGIEWANWPWGNSAKSFLDENGMFNHNYMERYWPKKAGLVGKPTRVAEDHRKYEFTREDNLVGIRNGYGDLDDVVALLRDDPLTRQAWLPIFFPEDTGLNKGQRKPCSLGYQFMLREGRFHIYYPLRSCDFYKHWSDDVYLTIRLGLWVLDQLRERDPDTWRDVRLGDYVMHCTSLHVFENDFYSMGGRP